MLGLFIFVIVIYNAPSSRVISEWMSALSKQAIEYLTYLAPPAIFAH